MPSQSSGPVGGSGPAGRHRRGGDLFVRRALPRKRRARRPAAAACPSAGKDEGRGIFAFSDAPGVRVRPKTESAGEYFDGHDIEHIRKKNGSWTSVWARPWRLGLLRIAIKLHLVVPNDNYWDDGPRGEM